MKWRVSMTHRVEGSLRMIGAFQEFDTSADIEARMPAEAIENLIMFGLRQGHEVSAISAYLLDGEKLET